MSVSGGIRQNLTNQMEHFIEPFFTTVQFVMAGNTSEGLRHGAIRTKEKYYLDWKNFEGSRDEVSRRILAACLSYPDKLD